MASISYSDAGVDIEKGDRFASSIQGLMQRTFDGRIVDLPGGFAGLFSVDFEGKLWRRNYKHPVLVSSTDGVGTKLKLAFMSGIHDTVGIDLVAMCVNDIVALGAEPLFFLDYLATGNVDEKVLFDVVKGISDGCRQCDCALLGGETAEMPGFYADNEYDMAGFAVGVIERKRIINGSSIEPGDKIIGLPSSGLHSNGFSLARKIFFDHARMELDDDLADWGISNTVCLELLKPTVIYAAPLREVLTYYEIKKPVHGLAHITGGGLPGNIERILPPGCDAVLNTQSWEIPGIFELMQELGGVKDAEMYRTFNMGIGFTAVVSEFYHNSILKMLTGPKMKPVVIGDIEKGTGKVRLV